MIQHTQGVRIETPPSPQGGIASSLPAEQSASARLFTPHHLTRRLSDENLRTSTSSLHQSRPARHPTRRAEGDGALDSIVTAQESGEKTQRVARKASKYARRRFDAEQGLKGPEGPRFWPSRPHGSSRAYTETGFDGPAWQAYEEGFELDKLLAPNPRLQVADNSLEENFRHFSFNRDDSSRSDRPVQLAPLALEQMAAAFWLENRSLSLAEKDAKLNHFVGYLMNGADGTRLTASQSCFEALLSLCSRLGAYSTIHYTLLRLGDLFNTPLMRLQYLQLRDSSLAERLRPKSPVREDSWSHRTLFLGQLASGSICWFTASHHLAVDADEHHVRGFFLAPARELPSERVSRSPRLSNYSLSPSSPSLRAVEPRVFPQTAREPNRLGVKELWVARPCYVRLNLAGRQIENFDCRRDASDNPALALLIGTNVGHFLLTDPLTFAESGQEIFGQEIHWFRGNNELDQTIKRIGAGDYDRLTRRYRSTLINNLIEG